MVSNITGDAITSFKLEIEEGSYVFGTGDASNGFQNAIKNSMYTDVGVGVTGSVDPNNAKVLNVNFTGLTQGKMAIFHIDLDPSNPNDFSYPDYRMVLFGAPLEGEDPTEPAVATITRASGPAIPELSFANAMQRLWESRDVQFDARVCERRRPAVPGLRQDGSDGARDSGTQQCGVGRGVPRRVRPARSPRTVVGAAIFNLARSATTQDSPQRGGRSIRAFERIALYRRAPTKLLHGGPERSGDSIRRKLKIEETACLASHPARTPCLG